MEVLRYVHDDYEVILRTRDIIYSWEKFKGRINYSRNLSKETDIPSPEEYSKYSSKDECKLYLSPVKEEQQLDQGTGKSWDKLWPVVYETCKYQIKILFHGVDEKSTPEIRHVRKDIEESFYLDQEHTSPTEKSLTGEIDFINEPGVFKLDFSYQKEGVIKESFITFDVVSPKLDTKSDYKTLLREVNEEYENVIYRYLSLTIQQFSRGKINSDATWMSAFQSVVDDYLKNVKRIIHNPHSKTITHQSSRKAEYIKKWTPRMEERLAEVKKEKRWDEYYFRFNESHSTQDTMENRFVKYTLQSIGKQLTKVISTVLNKSQEELSERHRKMWEDYRATINKLSTNPFFKSIGKFEGMKKESLVLQSRTGYQQIYKDWLKLKRGIDLYNGSANIGTLQIWEIYELWCFIKMKHLVAEVLGIDVKKPEHESLVTEPKGSLLNPFTNSTLDHVVVFKYPPVSDSDSEERKIVLSKHAGDKITLHYQHTFNRNSGGDQYEPGINTATTEQRPDIILNIQKDSGEIYLTYLYDAKYKVINDKKLDKDFEELDNKENMNMPGGDYPPPESINQMHRYRDAIYYSKKDEPYKSKEIIGGYILFPGRGNDENIKKRYYSQSIETVNIGAFPLLPNEGGDTLLKEHLDEILMKYVETDSHVAKAKPQRTLAYVSEEEKASLLPDDIVMIAKTNSADKRLWTFKHQWYNIPLSQVADSPWMKAKYILICLNDEQFVGNLCRIVKTRHDVWTKQRLISEEYPTEPSSSAYFMIRIHKPEETPVPLRDLQFNIKDIDSFYWGNKKMPFYLVKLKDFKVL